MSILGSCIDDDMVLFLVSARAWAELKDEGFYKEENTLKLHIFHISLVWHVQLLLNRAGASFCSSCVASSCLAGQYLSGCGEMSAGTCKACPSERYSALAGKLSPLNGFPFGFNTCLRPQRMYCHEIVPMRNECIVIKSLWKSIRVNEKA